MKRLAILVAAAALVVLAGSTTALAGNYKVQVCTEAMVGGEGLQYFSNNPVGSLTNSKCWEKSPGAFTEEKNGTVGGSVGWELIAPLNTKIRKLDVDVAISHTEMSFVEWSLLAAGAGAPLILARDQGQSLPAPGHQSFPLNTTAIGGQLLCPFKTCPGGQFIASLHNLTIELEDGTLPVLADPTLPGGSLRGVVHVGYSARDLGSGITGASMIIDGVARAVVPDTNGGHCQLPYRYLVPCRLEVDSSLELDTRVLADGRHEVEVAVTDAAAGRRVSGPVAFTVRNVPTNARRPAVGGAAAVGVQLTADPGTWEGGPVSLQYRWLRCPAAVKAADTSSCAAIGGASNRQYVTTPADAGSRMLVEVTATNATGSTVAASAPTDVIPATTSKPAGPRLTRVTLTRKRFPTAKGGAAGGTTVLGFTTDRGGKLTLLIDRVRGTKKTKHIITLAATIKSGRSSVPLGARIGSKVLTPGKYRVTIQVRDRKGVYSDPARVYFTVTPARH